MLLDAKCNIDARDDVSYQHLIVFFVSSHLQRRPNNLFVSIVKQRGNTALHHAAMNGHADIIAMLIDAGSDVDAQDKVTE